VNKTEKDMKLPDDAMDVGEAASEDMKVGANEEVATLAPGEEDGITDARGITDV
jgi:hypothetical protein